MAAPVCTVAGFVSGAACFTNFSTEERKSLLIYFNVLELAAIGGTNYVEQMGAGGTLMTASTCYLPLGIEACPPPLEYLVIAYNNAINAGASPASTVATQAAAIACNKNFSPAQKDAQLLWLACQLGKHATYPQ